MPATEAESRASPRYPLNESRFWFPTSINLPVGSAPSPFTRPLQLSRKVSFTAPPSNFCHHSSQSSILRREPLLFKLSVRVLIQRIDHETPFAQGIDDAPPNVSTAALPPEFWQQIVLHLDLRDVLKLVLVSKLNREGSNLRHPHGLVGLGHHLAAVFKDALQGIRCIFISASFSAARAPGIAATVFVGQDAT